MGRINGEHTHNHRYQTEQYFARGRNEALQPPDNKQLESPPTASLKEMLNSEVLTSMERQRFRQLQKAEGNHIEADYSRCLEIFSCRLGHGVRATHDIPAKAYLGNYFGRLDRKLPEQPRYSFSVGTSANPLYINSEASSDRCILA